MTSEEYLAKQLEYEGYPCSFCTGVLELEPDGVLRCNKCGYEYLIWEDGALGCEIYSE